MAGGAWRRRDAARRLVVVLAAVVGGLATVPVTASPAGALAVGNDVSWPQCGRPLPAGAGFGIIGVNDGRPFTDNPCLVGEFRWAATAGPPGLYLNTSNPGSQTTAVNWYGQRTPDPSCGPGNDRACAYDFGWTAARYAFGRATSQVKAGPGHTWWLDVETTNTWSHSDRAANMADVQGSIDFLRSAGVTVGVYSTSYQWGVITGGVRIPAMPNWVAGAPSATRASSYCSASRSFTGGPVMVVQYATPTFDYDYPCPGSDAVLRPKAPPADFLTSLLTGLGRLLGQR